MSLASSSPSAVDIAAMPPRGDEVKGDVGQAGDLRRRQHNGIVAA
jgi:hypothetical protein